MDRQNLIALGLSYLYVFVVLFGAELVRKFLGASGDFTRKAVHIGVGMWSIPTLFLFNDWRIGIIPPLTFIVFNYLSFRFELLKSIEMADSNNLGTVFFPISFALLLAVFWRPGSETDLGYVAVAGLMAMTWGDSMASILGKRYGTRSYRIFGHSRTMEGTTAMFVASSASILPVLALMGGLDWHPAIAFAMIAGTVAAAVESCSIYGSDNLTVPIATAATVFLMVRLSSGAA